jgi:hypothetical protein
LQSYLDKLKKQLIEVINDDYNDFVSLSTKLVNVDGAVLRMQKPLLEVKVTDAACFGVRKSQVRLLQGQP